MAMKSSSEYFGLPSDTVAFCRKIFREQIFFTEFSFWDRSPQETILLEPQSEWPSYADETIESITFFRKAPQTDPFPWLGLKYDNSGLELLAFHVGKQLNNILLASYVVAWSDSDSGAKIWRSILGKFKKETKNGLWGLVDSTKIYDFYSSVRYFPSVIGWEHAGNQMKRFADGGSTYFISEPKSKGILFDRPKQSSQRYD